MNEYKINNTWIVTEKPFDFDLHKFVIEGQNDKSYYGFLYPYDLEQQEQLRRELQDGTFDSSEWPIEWQGTFRYGIQDDYDEF